MGKILQNQNRGASPGATPRKKESKEKENTHLIECAHVHRISKEKNKGKQKMGQSHRFASGNLIFRGRGGVVSQKKVKRNHLNLTSYGRASDYSEKKGLMDKKE